MRTGWAFGTLADTRPVCGHWIIPASPDYGLRFAAFENALLSLVHELEPTHLVRVNPLKGQAGGLRALLAYGWDTHIATTCYRERITPMQQWEQTVRAGMLAKGWRADVEAEVLYWCREMAIPVRNHDEGDAAVLWAWTRAELVRQRRIAA